MPASRTFITTGDLDATAFACNGSGELTIQETLTSLTLNPATSTLVYTDEAGVTTSHDICQIVQDNCSGVADLSWNAVTEVWTVTYDDGTTATIAQQDDVVTSGAFDTALQQLTLTTSDGGTVVIPVDVCGAATANCPTFSDVSYNPATGDLVLTRLDATTETVSISTADGFVDSVSYDPGTQDLTISWNTAAGLANTVIDLSGLVDVYGLAVSDSTCVDMTLTGTGTAGDPWTISAQPIIDVAATNILECNATGMSVDWNDSFDQLTTTYPTLDCTGLPTV